jgi:P3 major capsid protein
MATAQELAQQAQNLNNYARAMINQNGQRMVQQIFSQTFVPANQSVVNIPPRNVGLIMGFWVKVVSVISNTTGGAVAITPTNFGAANLLSQIQFTDLNNLVRHQTTGWHCNFLNTVKGRVPYGSALLNTTMDGINVSGAYGSNWTVINEPASIADGGTGTVTMWYYVPLAYTDGDYRGAIFANVVNATLQLQLTINTNVVGPSTVDTTNQVYKAAAGAGSNTSTTITVYQDYIDQIPMAQGSYVLPMLDLSTIYEMKYTTFSAITAGNDFPMQYPNFRDFLSVFAIYNSNPAIAAGRNAGSDINYWALQAANLTNVFKLEPSLVALRSRSLIHTDFPLGVYYFGSRAKPIATTQYGNMQLVLNAITAAAGAYCQIGWESFGLQNVITQAGSLPAS